MVSLLSSSLMLNTPQNINLNQLSELKYFTDYAPTSLWERFRDSRLLLLYFLVEYFLLVFCYHFKFKYMRSINQQEISR